VYCSIETIDLLSQAVGRPVAIQTDHRSPDEIEAEPELSTLFAMARVLNARGHLAEDGHPDAAVHYVLPAGAPPLLVDALTAVGATLERTHTQPLGPPSREAIAGIADRAFGDLARRAARRIGTRDLAMALRMLEGQTFADPPERSDEPLYWQRVLELAALAGELLRAKYPHALGWVQSDRSIMPFGFGIDASTIMFPTNRAQRVIEDGADESLFKLLVAAEETMRDPSEATTRRLMPSLRDRRTVELDEVVWRPVLADAGPVDLPIVVCGVDGESTFGMIRRDALAQPPDEAMAQALANLAAEAVDLEDVRAGELHLVAVSGSFYAAEKLLDHELMQRLHARFDAELLAAAVPTRGLLLVTTAQADSLQLARFAALVATRFEEGGGRAISPTIVLLRRGLVAGFIDDLRADRASTAPVESAPDKRPSLLRRLFGRR